MPTETVLAAARTPGAARQSAGSCHLLTPEYPPTIGGLADYTRILGRQLTALGWNVQVWVAADAGASDEQDHSFEVHHLGALDTIRRLSAAGREFDRFPAPRRLVVQWVPHGFGCRSMNVLFCLWLWFRRVWRGDEIVLMVHEPSLGFVKGRLRHNVVAAVHRIMTVILMQAVSRVCMSIPAWQSRLQPFACGRAVPFSWLPIPSNVPVEKTSPDGDLRRALAGDGRYLIGHFGTHSGPIVALLLEILPRILASDPEVTVLLIGQNGEAVQNRLPQWRERIVATGILRSPEISAHLQACDLLLQPYPDGVSTRRTSAMAALAHGVPLVTTVGELSEDFWNGNQFARTVPVRQLAALSPAVHSLLRDPARRAQLGWAGHRLYEEKFAPARIAAELASVLEHAATSTPRASGIAN